MKTSKDFKLIFLNLSYSQIGYLGVPISSANNIASSPHF